MSIRLKPASTKVSSNRNEVGSSTVQPKTLPPKASGATSNPVLPSLRFSIGGPSQERWYRVTVMIALAGESAVPQCVMEAMVLKAPHTALELRSVADPRPGPGQLVVKVDACGVCRTDLHVVDGELPHARSPIIPGHEIVGTVVDTGDGVDSFARGDRVGVPWLASTCGSAPIAGQAARTFATTPGSPDTRWMAGTPSMWSPTTGSASRCRPEYRRRRSPPGCVRG